MLFDGGGNIPWCRPAEHPDKNRSNQITTCVKSTTPPERKTDYGSTGTSSREAAKDLEGRIGASSKTPAGDP